MKQTFKIKGMHCESCTDKITKKLLKVDGVSSVEVTLDPPRADFELHKSVPIDLLKSAVGSAGDYTLIDIDNETNKPVEQSVEETSLYPLFLIIFYITMVVLIAGLSSDSVTPNWLMQQFMAGFFITFSFFKLLDLKGFVSAFRGYDLIAKQYPAYGWSYPLIELMLGFAFLSGVLLVPAYLLTIFIMGVGAIGVLKAILNKNSIQCACLGTVLNLPMTKITLLENLSMVVMSIIMLIVNFI